MDSATAERIFEDMMRSTQHALIRSVAMAAIRYAQIRAEWYLLSVGERAEADKARSIAHNSFIDALNILSRQALGAGEQAEWRRELGNDRRFIGDYACHVACFLGLKSR